MYILNVFAGSFLCWILISLRTSSAMGFGMNLILVPGDDFAQIFCTMELLGKYFKSNDILSGSLLQMSISTASLHIQKRLLDAIHNQKDFPWSVVVDDIKATTVDSIGSESFVLHEKPQCYFVVVENLEDEDLEDIFENWKASNNWNPLAQFVVLYTSIEETDEEMTEVMVEILLSFMSKKMYNVNVIGQNEENSYFYGKTVFPYHPDNNCGNRVISIETLDICEFQDVEEDDDSEAEYDNTESMTMNYSQNQSEISQSQSSTEFATSTEYSNYNDDNEDERNPSSQENNTTIPFNKRLYLEELYRGLFLDKFPKDLSGCALIAAFRPWEPYVFTEEDETNLNLSETTEAYNMIGNDSDYLTEKSAEKKLSGIEYQLLQIIGEQLNIRIDFEIENKNLYHLFQHLIDGDVEMVVGGIDEDPSISQFVSSTVPYHQDDLTWCVAKAKRVYSLFSFLAIFTPLTWTLTSIFLICTSIIVSLVKNLLRLRIQYLNGRRDIVFAILGIILSQSKKLGYLHSKLKLTFGMAFLLGLFLMNFYQSFLVSTLTTPRSAHQISTLKEIYLNRMVIMSSVENVRHFNKEGEIFKYIRKTIQMCYDIEACMIEIAQDENMVIAVSREYAFYNPRIPRDQLFCFDRNENLYIRLISLLLPKKYHLLHKINPIIQSVIESGHMEKWASDLDTERRIQDRNNKRHEKKYSLSLDQIRGTFVLAAILCSLSSLVFLLERFVYRMVKVKNRKKRKSKFFEFIHRQLEYKR